jgi:hypothetical protein
MVQVSDNWADLAAAAASDCDAVLQLIRSASDLPTMRRAQVADASCRLYSGHPVLSGLLAVYQCGEELMSAID